MRLKGNDSLTLGGIYRSPTPNRDGSSTDIITELLGKVTDSNPSHLIILGDFNYPGINWESWTSHHAHEQMFIDCLSDCFLHQHINEYTRYRTGQQPHILDLLITNEEGMIGSISYLPGLGLSDHQCILFDVNLYAEQTRRKEEKYRYHKGDYQAINNTIINIDWYSELESMNVDESWNLFSTIYQTAIDQHIPKNTGMRLKKKKLWMTKEALRQQKKKHRSWKRFRDSGDDVDYLRSRGEAIKLRKMTRNLRRKFEKDIANNIKSNPKAFWGYANSSLKCRTNFGIMKNKHGITAENDEEKAELFNLFFSSVFTDENVQQIPTLEARHKGNLLTDLVITTNAVKNKLKSLKSSKSAGPDGFHPRVLKETAETICTPLALIFRKSLKEGCLPQSWKDANITPIHKKGKKDAVENYRPISLTSVIGKVMESLVRDAILKQLISNDLLCEAQHGFLPGRSCITQLLEVMELWTSSLDEGYEVDAIYLDFSKAFDSVPHERLMNKLRSYGITGNVEKWLYSFLTHRRQRVVVNGKTSQWLPVRSGVPQGSVLGPTVFVVFINDLPEVVNSIVKIYADDTKLFREIRLEDDCDRLQADLDSLTEWSKMWQLQFNTTKCRSLHIGQHSLHYQYCLDGDVLEEVSEERDLGVIMDSQLKFHSHVASAVLKANRVLATIRRTFLYRDKDNIRRLYKSLVRPILEYANGIWYPRYASDLKAIEKVQRRATKIVPSLKEMDYGRRLRVMKLPSIRYRLRRGDMIQTYKIIHGIDSVNKDLFFTTATTQATRGHPYKLFMRRSRLSVRQNTFSVRVVNDWNSLPEEIVTASTVNRFKTKLDKFWSALHYVHAWDQ